MTPSFSRGVKFILFGVTFALLILCAAGYVYAQAPLSLSAAEPLTKEQSYYKQLTYAANEMHNQLDRWRASEAVDPGRLNQDKIYVDALIADLQQPPEEQIVTQRIVEDLYLAYSAVHDDLRSGRPADFQATDRHYKVFLDNAAIVQLLNQYQGLNVICH